LQFLICLMFVLSVQPIGSIGKYCAKETWHCKS
jgi:hypothetical protein